MERTLTTSPDDSIVRMSINMRSNARTEGTDRLTVSVAATPGNNLVRVHYRSQHAGISSHQQQHLRMRVRLPLSIRGLQ